MSDDVTRATVEQMARDLDREPEGVPMVSAELSEALDRLAAAFEERSEREFGDIRYTRSGYLTRDSVEARGMGSAFAQAAREVRAALKAAQAQGEG